MKKNNIGYLLREGVRGVFVNGFMSFAAVCVTVACLIIMGSFLLILFNLNEMIVDLEQENEMLVYIDESYSEAKAKSVGSQLNLISNIREAKRSTVLSKKWTATRCSTVWTPLRSATAMSSRWRTTA